MVQENLAYLTMALKKQPQPRFTFLTNMLSETNGK
jgi:hypothetical protein